VENVFINYKFVAKEAGMTYPDQRGKRKTETEDRWDKDVTTTPALFMYKLLWIFFLIFRYLSDVLFELQILS